MAPNPSEIASSFRVVCRLGLKIFRHAVVVTSSFNFSIVSSWCFSSLDLISFFNRLAKITSAQFDRNFLKYMTMPMNH